MAKRKPPKSPLGIVDILIPEKDNDNQPFKREVYKQIQWELEELFGGWSIVGHEPMPGGWKQRETGKHFQGRSWRYRVDIDSSRFEELDQYIAKIAARLGQYTILRERFPQAEAAEIPAKEDDNE